MRLCGTHQLRMYWENKWCMHNNSEWLLRLQKKSYVIMIINIYLCTYNNNKYRFYFTNKTLHYNQPPPEMLKMDSFWKVFAKKDNEYDSTNNPLSLPMVWHIYNDLYMWVYITLK